MIANTKLDIWIELAREEYPTLNVEEIIKLSMVAAAQWYIGDKNKLTELYDQYVMVKTLKGIEIQDGN